MLILTSFSLNMLPPLPVGGEHIISVRLIEEADVRAIPDITSAVGHPATAEILSARLGREVPANRTNVILGDEPIIVAQLIAPRLGEGQILSPAEVAGLPISYFLVGLVRPTGE